MLKFLEKVRVVGVARRNSYFMPLCGLLGLLSSSPSLATTKAPPPPPRSPQCELISKGPGVALQTQEILLHNFLNEWLDAVRTDQWSRIEGFFHPRAKRTKDLGEKIKMILKNRYDVPWQFSVFRVWRITTPEAHKAILDSCPDASGASIIVQNGYETQYMVWLQIMGQNELGRMMIAVAPDKGRMYATALRLQQWTQQGEDAEAWVQKAETAFKADQKIPAYFALDVAHKLLAGEDLLIYPRQRQILDARNGIVSQAELVKKLNEALNVKSIAYIGSLLTKEGTGILLREVIEKQEPTSDLQKRCLSRGEALIKLGWLAAGKTGLRCNYIFPGMDPERDSPMGGLYFAPEDLVNTKK
ncbi:MAG: hypothetical protein M3Q07_17945 [Pseudobdellovibrionaceae bacterium]|nr:hypothetical protein [Pseudobdellovibrionaceae bacterium]